MRGSLSREGVSVQGGGLCPGRGSLSREGVSVQGGGLCPGGSVEGSLSKEGVSVEGVSVKGGICQGDLPYGKERADWNAFL